MAFSDIVPHAVLLEVAFYFVGIAIGFLVFSYDNAKITIYGTLLTLLAAVMGYLSNLPITMLAGGIATVGFAMIRRMFFLSAGSPVTHKD